MRSRRLGAEKVRRLQRRTTGALMVLTSDNERVGGSKAVCNPTDAPEGLEYKSNSRDTSYCEDKVSKAGTLNIIIH